MPNYKKGKIYKLCSLISDKIYVGSTCQTLCKRIGDHKIKSKKHQERQVYKHINQIGWNNYKIILIENFPCNNKEQLEKQERYYIETLHSELNYNIPTRTIQEYIGDNKDKLIKIQKQYREDNKEILTIKRRQEYNLHKQQYASSSKKYYENNKELLKCKQKLYFLDNKDKIKSTQKIYYLKCKYKKLIIGCNDISKEHDELVYKFNLIH